MNYKRFSFLVVVLAFAFGCGGTNYILTGTNHSVGTDGRVEVDEIDGGNSMVTIELEHLPPPGRLTESATCYIAWFQLAGQVNKAGVMEYDDGDRTATVMATTPENEFTVIVTAESTTDVAAPSDYVVARQAVD